MIPARFFIRRNALGAALAAALFAAATPARGGTPADEATASALFQEAKTLAQAGDYEHALAKYQEAQHLSPTSGTLLNIAACLEKLGRVASAWGTYKQVEVEARNAGDTDREQEAQRRALALAPLLAKLAIVVPPAARLAGLEVRRDGEVVGEGQWGSPLPLDPGQHVVDAAAPKHKPWSTVVRIDANGSAASIEVPALEEGGPAPAGGSAWGPRRIAGLSIGGAGVVSIAVGAILGVLSGKQLSDAKSEGNCNAALTVCNQTGLNMDASAKTLAHGSTATFVLGGAAVAAGVVLWATAPSAGDASRSGVRVTVGPMAGVEAGGVLVRGGW